VPSRAGLDALADAGSFAAPAWGVGVHGGVAFGAFSARVAAALWPGQHTVYGPMPAFGGDFVLASGGLLGCYALRYGRVEPAFCAGIELGAMHAAGTGVTTPTAHWVFEAAQVDQIAATFWLVGPVGLRVAAGVAVPLVRPTFVLDGIGTIYTQAPVAARASAGVELSF
jgi:hypothetical protein